MKLQFYQKNFIKLHSPQTYTIFGTESFETLCRIFFFWFVLHLNCHIPISVKWHAQCTEIILLRKMCNLAFALTKLLIFCILHYRTTQNEFAEILLFQSQFLRQYLRLYSAISLFKADPTILKNIYKFTKLDTEFDQPTTFRKSVKFQFCTCTSNHSKKDRGCNRTTSPTDSHSAEVLAQ